MKSATFTFSTRQRWTYLRRALSPVPGGWSAKNTTAQSNSAPWYRRRCPTNGASSNGFKIEADASEKGIVKSASFTMPVKKGLIKAVVEGEKSIAKLFTKEQEDFLAEMANYPIDFSALAILGPLKANRWKFEDPACPWKITAELWRREDGERLMEVSIKAPIVQAAAAIGGFMAFLAEVGAERDSKQQTKTHWALDFYAAKIRGNRKE